MSHLNSSSSLFQSLAFSRRLRRDHVYVEAYHQLVILRCAIMLRTPLPLTHSHFHLHLPESREDIRSILHASSHQTFPYTISPPSEPTTTNAAFSHAYHFVAAARASLIGPSQCSLKNDSLPVREDAKLVLESFLWVTTSYPIGRPQRGTTCFCAARSSRCVPPSPGCFDAS